MKIILAIAAAGLVLLSSCRKDETVIPTVRVIKLTTAGGKVNRMAFTSSTTGFAACESGKVLKTTNSGENWTEVNGLPSLAWRDIQFPTATTGYILGFDSFGDGTVYKTSDGGASWTMASTPNMDADHMVFPTETVGYIITATYSYKTTSGGTSWNIMSNFPQTAFLPQVIGFASRDTGYFVDFDGYLYRTTNGGNAWSTVTNMITTPRRILFTSKTTGFAINGGGQIFMTTDSGFNWSEGSVSSNDTEFTLLGIDVASGTGMAVGDQAISVSRDGGSSWQFRYNELGVNPVEVFTDIHMIDEMRGLASSVSGNFYRIEIGEQ
jgi:photosystem II stability/assembly factor-like uncharacterized protein